jgi:hypothetical protein
MLQSNDKSLSTKSTFYFAKAAIVTTMLVTTASPNGVVALVRDRALGQQNNGPYAIEWEGSDEDDWAALWERIGITDRLLPLGDARERARAARGGPGGAASTRWLVRQRVTLGLQEFAPEGLHHQMSRTLSLRAARVSAGTDVDCRFSLSCSAGYALADGALAHAYCAL